MAKKAERKGLGRGLSALLAETGEEEDAAPIEGAKTDRQVPIERIRANPEQPRRSFGEKELGELAESIRRNGIIQPLIVRRDPKEEGFFQIVAGERRWRAAQRAQIHDVPVILRDLSDEDVLEIAIIENIQRVDLNPVEEALGYRQLMDRFGHTQEEMATALGKSRSHIANVLRLLSLPEIVLDHLREGRITSGHARALITAENPAELCRQVIAKGLSVRQTEALVNAARANKPARKQKLKPEKDADTRAIEADLAANLGMPVQIDHAPGEDGGTMHLRYRSLEDLDRLLQRLGGP